MARAGNYPQRAAAMRTGLDGDGEHAVYLEEKIWQPFGMEADAYWNLTEAGGGEFGGCCINATLRDYGRLGLFALFNARVQAVAEDGEDRQAP